MKTHEFLETMTAKEFVDYLEDFGLYSMAIDTMVSTIEKQGRNQSENHRLEWDKGGCLTPQYGENPYLPEGYKKQLEEKGWYKTPDAVAVTSEILIDELNNPTEVNADPLNDTHDETNNACWDSPFEQMIEDR